MRLPRVAFLLCGCAIAACATASLGATPVYKWTDAQGVVHYSDKAPVHATEKISLLTLPELPPVNPEAIEQEQAHIASIHAWYQRVLNRQTQFQYDQYLAQQANQPATTPAPAAVTEVSYVTPLCWDCGRLWRRRPYRHQMTHGPSLPSPVFKSNIWSTQPNRFTQSLYRPH